MIIIDRRHLALIWLILLLVVGITTYYMGYYAGQHDTQMVFLADNVIQNISGLKGGDIFV